MVESTSHYNAKENIMHTSILRPYYTVGREMGWKSLIGLGITPEAVRFALHKQASLCVYVDDENRTYWITSEVLGNWLMDNPHEGHNNGKPIIYIPADIFADSKPVVMTQETL